MAIWHRLVLHGPEQHWYYRSDLEWLKGHRCMAKLNLKKTGRPQRTNIELEWLLPSLTLILSPLIAHLRHNIPRNIRTHKPCISYVRDISQPCLRQTHRICSVSCSSPAAPAVEESMIFFKRFFYSHQSHCVSDPGWFFWQMMCREIMNEVFVKRFSILLNPIPIFKKKYPAAGYTMYTIYI